MLRCFEICLSFYFRDSDLFQAMSRSNEHDYKSLKPERIPFPSASGNVMRKGLLFNSIALKIYFYCTQFLFVFYCAAFFLEINPFMPLTKQRSKSWKADSLMDWGILPFFLSTQLHTEVRMARQLRLFLPILEVKINENCLQAVNATGEKIGCYNIKP